MKLLRWGPPGRERPGLLDDAQAVRDLSGHVPDIAASALLPASIAALSRLDISTLPFIPRGARIGPCVGAVGKIVGVGLNYRDHAAESGMAVPQEPPLFLKP